MCGSIDVHDGSNELSIKSKSASLAGDGNSDSQKGRDGTPDWKKDLLNLVVLWMSR